ncbi:MAG: hypothetical protein ABI442_16645 [Gemmatimonadaceae bacterium]
MKRCPFLASLAVAIVGIAACTEPRAAAVATPAPVLAARLELSDSAPRAGDSLLVRLRLNGAAASKIVSFTGGLSYDSTMLRFVSETALADGATRVSNPAAGLIRAAGVNANGFADGVLAEYRFVVVNPQGVHRLSLGIDELHDQSRADASKTVVVRRAAGVIVP